jgi:hypothetical protein
MLKPGTRIVVIKGYNGAKGTILERTLSSLEFYIVELDDGLKIVVGPSAFVVKDEK